MHAQYTCQKQAASQRNIQHPRSIKLMWWGHVSVLTRPRLYGKRPQTATNTPSSLSGLVSTIKSEADPVAVESDPLAVITSNLSLIIPANQAIVGVSSIKFGLK